MNANNNNSVNGTKISEQLFNEAPASWNTRYLDPSGYECQITLRSETGSELLEKAASAIAFLIKNGCTPCTNGKGNGYRNGNGNNNRPQKEPSAQVSTTDAPVNPGSQGNGSNRNNGHDHNWCPIHECEMKKWDKNGRVWFSHKVDGEWCTGKSKS